jgi:GAF domain-containing protein
MTAVPTPDVTGFRAAPILGLSPSSMSSRLSLIVDLATLLAREVDFDALLATACERLARALRADRASIWLVDAEHGDLVTRVALLPELRALRQPIERGIAGYVARTGRSCASTTPPRIRASIPRRIGPRATPRAPCSSRPSARRQARPCVASCRS